MKTTKEDRARLLAAHHPDGIDGLVGRVVQDLDEALALAKENGERAEAAEAKAAVCGGEWCAQNRAEGRGPCGACAWCCSALRAELEAERIARKEAERVGRLDVEKGIAALNLLQDNAALRAELAEAKGRAKRDEHARCVQLIRNRQDRNMGQAGEWADWLEERAP